MLPRLSPAEVTRQAETEYGRFGAVLRELSADEWSRPTDCPQWDVRALVAHVVGATEANAAPVEMVRQLRHGRSGISFGVDEVTAFQVRHRAVLTPAELVARFDAASPGAVRWRTRYTRFVGWVPFRVGAPVFEVWPLYYLAGIIYTRDVWMHRIDVCRATGRNPVLTAEHDGGLIAAVADEWLRRHGRPVTLTLTGPVGGRYRQGAGGPQIVLDAVEFCRWLSGRGPAPLATPVPF